MKTFDPSEACLMAPGLSIGGGSSQAWSRSGASEIEPFAIRVTTKRLPKMPGITGMSSGNQRRRSGTGGYPSRLVRPCQDLSIAGKRSVLDGSRSGLFFEAVRIVKEMREENTMEKNQDFKSGETCRGPFSSNTKGRTSKPSSKRSSGSKSRKRHRCLRLKKAEWPYADCYLGDGWSVAYRVS